MTTNTPKANRRRLAVKLNADSRVLVYGTVVLVTALAVTSLIASFSGLLSVADWARLHPRLRWTVPVMLDGAITVYTAAALIRRARGESTRLAWTGVVAGTLLSASANAVHVILAGATPDQPWVRGVGAGIAALSPVLAALAVHQLADLAVAGPDEELAPARRSARRAARGVAVQPAQTAAHAVPTSPEPTVEPVWTRRASTNSGSTSRTELREQVLALAAADPSLSHRQLAGQTGAPATTIGRWLREANEQDGQPELVAV